MTSRRTKDALAAAKKRGVKLGGYRKNAKFTAAARKAAITAKAAKVAKPAADLAPAIAERQAQRHCGPSQAA
jgi:DNA invertase Pin-like site-specific DNA recombinase